MITTVPAELVHRLDSIFMDVPGVDTVELAALLLEMTAKPKSADAGEILQSISTNIAEMNNAMKSMIFES